ncbi:MAG: hypothetical protein ABJB55_03685 [Actinomycetota bacterium]
MLLAAVMAGLLLWLLVPFFLRQDGSPVGADTAVYVWWMRLAGHDGLSAIGSRPGVPAVSLVLAGVTGASAVTTTAAIACVLVVVAASSGAALSRAGGATGDVSAVAAALTGIFATYLAAGHLSNVTFAALFLAGLACTFGRARPRGMVAAIALVGAAGLSHPDFLVAAIAIMVIAAMLAWVAHERKEAMTLIGVTAGGVALAGLGLATTVTGGPAFDVDTSRDVFLIRVGQLPLLRQLYLDRLVPKASGYALWAWLPLAAVGLTRRCGQLGRLLIAWCAVLAIGVVVGIARQPFPPHRVIAFGFCLPILAALGLEAIAVRLWRTGPLIVIAMIVVVAASATVTWMHAPRPFDAPVAASIPQDTVLWSASPTGTPVIVDLPTRGPGAVAAVLRAANLVRAEVPPEWIRDVLVRFPRPATADPEAYALWVDTESQVQRAVASASAAPREIRIDGATTSAVPLAPGASVVAATTDGGPQTTTPLAIAAVALVSLLVLGLAGAGWAQAAGVTGIGVAERAPAMGVAALILTAVVVDRLGVRITRPVAITLAILLSAAGYLVAAIGRRGSRSPGTRRSIPRGAGTTDLAPGRHPSLDTPSTT